MRGMSIVWDVPASYGDTVHYFAGIDAEDCYDIFVAFAESKGIEFG